MAKPGLAELLRAQIAATGPLTIAEYMRQCLYHPEFGYYTTQHPIGRSGDFVTAPEISQMFGECLGLALAQSWLDRGSPDPFCLVELGPGRGILMQDMLRATVQVPGFHKAMRLNLVEVSPTLRVHQAENLREYAPHWYDGLQNLPDLPIFLVANEFFDALPIRQFLRRDGAWCERVVGVSDGTLAFGLTEAAPLGVLDRKDITFEDGQMIETCAPAQAIAAEIGRRITGDGGVALIVDYGDWGSLGDTFQAVSGHQKSDPLDNPGRADLTAHVDFVTLAHAAAPATYAPLTIQGAFLERLGITARAEKLSQGLSGEALANLISSHRRLTHPEEMGSLFKCLALFQSGTPPPPGVDS